jgi:hypothetical protein
MLRFVVDWVDRIRGRSQPEEIEFLSHQTVATHHSEIDISLPPAMPPQLRFLEDSREEAALPAPQELGIRFQRREFLKLLKAVGHWQSVELLTANGSPIEAMADVPRGADGGIDVVIRIVTDTERGAAAIAARIRNMIVRQTY